MRRRSSRTLAIVAVLVVGWNAVTAQPTDTAFAADPAAELAQTQQELAQARAAQEALEASANQQRAQLQELKAQSAQLDGQLNAARAELQAVPPSTTG